MVEVCGGIDSVFDPSTLCRPPEIAIYQNVLIDYILYRAYSKDTEYTADQNRAAAHQSAYLAALNGKAKVEAGTNPNITAPANPNVTPNTR